MNAAEIAGPASMLEGAPATPSKQLAANRRRENTGVLTLACAAYVLITIIGDISASIDLTNV